MQIVPKAITTAPPGYSVDATNPGDFILTHRKGVYSKAIAIGQRRKYGTSPYTHWTHAAAVTGHHGQLVEALGHGVVESHLLDYRDVEYHYISIGASNWDRVQMARFAEACVGRPYGYLEIVSLGATLLTGTSRLSFGNPGTLICSALVAQMLCRGDYIFGQDPNRMLPADLACEFDIVARDA